MTISAAGRMPALGEAVEAEVARIWSDARATRPALFNGRVFTADRITPGRIDGHWTEYRRVLAQIGRPELFEAQRTRSLSVNGLIACADGLVLGRRQANAIYMAGCWQAAPAGAIESRNGDEAIDLRQQLLAELDEELGLDGDALRGITPVLAMEHPDSRVVDVGCLLSTDLGFHSVETRWHASGNNEYDRLQLVPAEKVARFLEDSGPELLVSARLLMRCWSSRSAE